METNELSDHITEAGEHHHGEHGVSDVTFRKRVGLVISLLAVVLAITATGGSNAMKTAINANIERSDAWNFYQARNIRETATKLSRDQLELMQAGASDATRAAIAARLEDYKTAIQHYESDPVSDGKAELKIKAEAAEARRDLAQSRGESFEIAEALLQIAIVLASTCILTASRQLLLVSALFAACGVVLSANGFAPFFELPFGH
ncbi:MAG: hypothetical protein JWO51_2221 [Rhodospirillales bacterium]|jgi:hypothetical protein|nr:hypothetical protein [Rhodospirillales bacterium]